MTVASAAISHCKKAMKFGLALFRRGFNSSKCKTMAKMVVARIKLLRNKRQVVVKQMRRDIAMLLESGQDATARVRVEHVIREQNIMAANEFIELFCELIVARLPIIAKQRECPADLKEGISSLIFAAPRCSDIPELLAIRNIFEKKYGKDFVSAATDLRPNCGVNRMLIDKLSVRTPAGEVKLKVMKEIAKEYQVEWDTTDSEMELLKPPEELIEGPRTFVSATSLPMKPIPTQSVGLNYPTTRYSDNRERNTVHFEDTASAAEAAAESARKAMAAAQAAAFLSSKESNVAMGDQRKVSRRITTQGFKSPRLRGEQTVPSAMDNQKIYRRHSYNVPSAHSDTEFDESDCDEEPAGGIYLPPNRPANRDTGEIYRRHSYNEPSAHSDIKFDESDADEEFEMEEPKSGVNQPPIRPAPQVPSVHTKRDPVPHVHPKLPDYDALAARFEALKFRKP